MYSNGVLHHTYSTREAFDAIVPYAANAGTVCIWLYSNESYDRNVPQRLNWSLEEVVIRRSPGSRCRSRTRSSVS